MSTFIVYLFIINIICLLGFVLDWKLYQRTGTMTSDYILHLGELAGGAFVIVPLIFILKHRHKESFYMISLLNFTIWAFIGVLSFQLSMIFS